MSNILALSKVILRGTLTGFSVSKNKGLNILFWIFIGLFAFVPIVLVLSLFFKDVMTSLHQMNQSALLINIVLIGLVLVIFLFSMLQIPSVYYFSNDTEFFLTLPVKPYEIVLSKFLVVVLFEYIVVAAVFVPFMVIFAQVTGSISSLFFAAIVGLLLPILPIILSSIVIILLMNFVPFLRNKNTIMVLIGVITIALSLGLQFLINSSTMSLTQDRMIELIQLGNDSISSIMFTFFPSIRFAGSAIANSSIVDLILYILITLGLVVVYLFIAQQLYLNGATSIGDSAKSKTKFDSKQLSGTQNSSVVKNFFAREIKSIFRTPAYLLNIVLPIFIFPVLIILLPFINGQAESDIGLDTILPFIHEALQNPTNLLYYGLMIGAGVGLFVGMNNNTLSVTTISREAKELVHIKTYPIEYKDMLLGKFLVSILFNLFAMSVFLIALNFMIKLPLTFNLVLILVGLIATTFTGLGAIIIDLKKPNLKWTNETQVVKQSKNVMFSTFGSLILIALIVAAGVILNQFKILFVVLMLAILLVGIFAFGHYISTHSQDLVNDIEI